GLRADASDEARGVELCRVDFLVVAAPSERLGAGDAEDVAARIEPARRVVDRRRQRGRVGVGRAPRDRAGHEEGGHDRAPSGLPGRAAMLPLSRTPLMTKVGGPSTALPPVPLITPRMSS